MAQFQFREGLVLDFGHMQFEIHPDSPDFMEAWQENCNSAAKFAEELQKSGRTDAGAIREACDKMRWILDNTLGNGAVDAIFEERPIGFYDLLDVFSYITNEVTAYRDKRKAENAPAPMNREQRRAAARMIKPGIKPE